MQLSWIRRRIIWVQAASLLLIQSMVLPPGLLTASDDMRPFMKGQNLAVPTRVDQLSLQPLMNDRFLKENARDGFRWHRSQHEVSNQDDFDRVVEHAEKILAPLVQDGRIDKSHEGDKIRLAAFHAGFEGLSSKSIKERLIVVTIGRDSVTQKIFYKVKANWEYVANFYDNILNQELTGSVRGYTGNSVNVQSAAKSVPAEQLRPNSEMPDVALRDRGLDEARAVRYYTELKGKTTPIKDGGRKDEFGNQVADQAFVFLAGGLGTRMKSPLPKTLVNIVKGWFGQKDKNMNMLELQLRAVESLQKETGLKFHVYIMTSFQTDAKTMALLRTLDVDMNYVHLYSQGLAKRRFMDSKEELKAKYHSKNLNQEGLGWEAYKEAYEALMQKYNRRYGDELPDEMGVESFNPPGHMDAIISLSKTGALQHMKVNNIKYINQLNAHHVVGVKRMAKAMLGAKLRKTENKVILQVSNDKKAGGGLYDVVNSDGSTQKFVYDNSLIEYWAKESDSDDEKKMYAEKMKEANRSGLTSVANFVYDLSIVPDDNAIANVVSGLPRFTDIKKPKFEVNVNGEDVNILALLKQDEAQAQGFLLCPENNADYYKTPRLDTSEIKAKTDVPETFRHIILSLLKELSYDEGFQMGLTESANIPSELEQKLQDTYNALLATLIARESISKKQVVLQLNEEEALAFFGTDSNQVSLGHSNMLLLLLPLMKQVVSQAKGLDFDFMVQLPESIKNVDQWQANYGALLTLYGFDTEKWNVRVTQNNVQTQEEGQLIVDLQSLNGDALVNSFVADATADPELANIKKDYSVVKEAMTYLKNLDPVIAETTRVSEKSLEVLEGIQYQHTDPTQVVSKIAFGTAGYRPLAAVQDIVTMLGESNLESLVREGKLSVPEQKQLQSYMDDVKNRAVQEEVNDHVTALIGIAFARMVINHNHAATKEADKVKEVVVDYDTRFKGDQYAQILLRAMRAQFQKDGENITLILLKDYVSTPMMSLYMKEEKPQAWGLHVTSSHNPFFNTGFKPEYFGGRPAPASFTESMEQAYQDAYEEFAYQGKYPIAEQAEGVAYDNAALMPDYQAYLIKHLKSYGFLGADDDLSAFGNMLKDKKFIADANYGEAKAFWEAFQGQLGEQRSSLDLKNLDNTELRNFNFNKPEPSLANLKGRYANETGIDGILANDPDADRTAYIEVKNGKFDEITMNEIVALLMQDLIDRILDGRDSKTKNITLVTSLVSSQLAERLLHKKEGQLQEKGVTVHYVTKQPVGFKWLSDELANASDTHKVIGFEESGGMSTGLLEKDGPLGTLIALRLALKYSGGLRARLNTLKEELGYGLEYLKGSVVISTKNPKFETLAKERDALNEYFAELASLDRDSSDFQNFKEALQTSIGNGFHIGEILTKDGLRIELKDAAEESVGFVAFRLSGTEPKARIYIERIGDSAYIVNNVKKSLEGATAFFNQMVEIVLDKDGSDYLRSETPAAKLRRGTEATVTYVEGFMPSRDTVLTFTAGVAAGTLLGATAYKAWTASLAQDGVTEEDANGLIKSKISNQSREQLQSNNTNLPQELIDLMKNEPEIADALWDKHLLLLLGESDSSIALARKEDGQTVFAHAGHASSLEDENTSKGQKTIYLPERAPQTLTDFGLLAWVLQHEAAHVQDASTVKEHDESFDTLDEKVWPALKGQLTSYLSVLDMIEQSLSVIAHVEGTSTQLRVRDSLMFQSVPDTTDETSEYQLTPEGLILLLMAQQGRIQLQVEFKDLHENVAAAVFSKWRLAQSLRQKVTAEIVTEYSFEAIGGEVDELGMIVGIKALVAKMNDQGFNDIASRLKASA